MKLLCIEAIQSISPTQISGTHIKSQTQCPSPWSWFWMELFLIYQAFHCVQCSLSVGHLKRKAVTFCSLALNWIASVLPCTRCNENSFHCRFAGTPRPRFQSFAARPLGNNWPVWAFSSSHCPSRWIYFELATKFLIWLGSLQMWNFVQRCGIQCRVSTRWLGSQDQTIEGIEKCCSSLG